MCNDPEMSISGQLPLDRANFEIKLDRRSFWLNSLFIALLFLASVALAVVGPARLHLDAIAGAAVFGVIGLSAGLAGARQIRREPVVATLNNAGVTFRRHDLVGWEVLQEVRIGSLKPRLLFALRPLHYIAFLPARTADLPSPKPHEWLAVRLYGTNLLLMTETVTPGAEDILAAVERLSDVPIHR